MNATELVLRLVDRLVTQEHAMCVNERVDKEVWRLKEQNWFAKQDELEKQFAALQGEYEDVCANRRQQAETIRELEQGKEKGTDSGKELATMAFLLRDLQETHRKLEEDMFQLRRENEGLQLERTALQGCIYEMTGKIEQLEAQLELPYSTRPLEEGRRISALEAQGYIRPQQDDPLYGPVKSC